MKNFINTVKEYILYIFALLSFIGVVAFGHMTFIDFELGVVGMITCGFLTLVELLVQGICEVRLDLMDYIDADHEDMLVDINNIINPVVDDSDSDVPTVR